MKVLKKPLSTAFLLVSLIGVVYYMSSTNKTLSSLNTSSSSNLNAAETTIPKKQDLEYKQQQEKQQFEIMDKVHKGGQEKNAAAVSDEKPLKAETVKEIDEERIENDLNKDFTETPFMPKMANETLKAELGRASWRLFHTILARYPDIPTKPEQQTLKQYIELFAQVYPCGDCARHFRELLNKYPPQLTSRKNAALWGCHVHNKVNDRLGKETYDCTTILEDYDCGCGSDELEDDATLGDETLDHLRSIKIEETIENEMGG